jgi:hypothetical protein
MNLHIVFLFDFVDTAVHVELLCQRYMQCLPNDYILTQDKRMDRWLVGVYKMILLIVEVLVDFVKQFEKIKFSIVLQR